MGNSNISYYLPPRWQLESCSVRKTKSWQQKTRIRTKKWWDFSDIFKIEIFSDMDNFDMFIGSWQILLSKANTKNTTFKTKILGNNWMLQHFKQCTTCWHAVSRFPDSANDLAAAMGRQMMFSEQVYRH